MTVSHIGNGLHTLSLFPEKDTSAVMTPANMAALELALDELERRTDLGLVVLLGGRRAFCLGAELSFIESASQSELMAYLAQGRRLCERLAALPVPTIAAVGGMALGGGLELALACDIRWGDRRAAFGFPEGRSGLIPAWGGIERSFARMPISLAWEMLLGQRIGSERAAACGLISRVFESRGFMDAVVEQAVALATQRSEVLRALKSAAHFANKGQGDEALSLCFSLQTEREAVPT